MAPLALDKPKKSGLSIRLTESAVFLRTDGPSSRPHRNAETRSSLVRGLLVLELAKPTKIESIELELIATSSTAWPDGVGPRRVEVSEQHKVFHASTVYFKADSSGPTGRRAASVGPGTLPLEDDPTLDWDIDDLDSTALLQSPTHEASSTAGGVALTRSDTVTSQSNALDHTQESSSRVNPSSRQGRRVSVDAHYFHRIPISYHVQEDYPVPPYSPVDPASPSTLSPSNSIHASIHSEPIHPHAAQSLEEYRAELQTNLQIYQQSPSRTSLTSPRTPVERSLSRRPSVYDVPEEPQDNPSSQNRPLTTPRPRSSPSRARPPSSLRSDEIPHAPANGSNPSLSNDSTNNLSVRQPSLSVERPGRSRNRSRFSLTAVADAFREVVRSTSPLTHRKARTSRSRDASGDDFLSRGRTMERNIPCPPTIGENGNPPGPVSVPHGHTTRGPNEPTLYSMPGDHRTSPRNLDIATIWAGVSEVKERRDLGNGWKEFKAGTYTYPISFSIPATAPPSLRCDFGHVQWKLHAHVHRPGAFKSRYTATRDVHVIACPTEEDTEDSENIIVERHWDQQLQYLISISGRSFHIGGVMPVSFAFMPLAKVKIHRLSMFIEERVDYYTNMRRIARSDPITRFLLLSAKYEGKHPPHLLPLDSSDVDALRNSPLYPLINPEDDESQVASELMGPGPWSFHHDLKLPESCNAMHFTNKNRRANMTVSHMLKVVIRVERGDDQYLDTKSGKRKLFDIVVQTPVHILSCRCNPEWTSLPRYEETFNTRTDYVIPNCPCQVKKLVQRVQGTPSTDTAGPGTSGSTSRNTTSSGDNHNSSSHSLHVPAPLEHMFSHLSNDSTSASDDSTQHTHLPKPPGHGSSHNDSSSSPSNHPNHHHIFEHIIQAVHPHETSPIDQTMSSLRLLAEQNPQNAQMVRASRQFGRLVAGFESEMGEAPPTYDSVARAQRGQRSRQGQQSRHRSRGPDPDVAGPSRGRDLAPISVN